MVVLPVYCQDWTPQDSLRLRKLLEGNGEIKINTNILDEMGKGEFLGSPKMSTDKSWIGFDVTMPTLPQEERQKIILTLRPYSASTRFDWDPVYQRKIRVNKDTWRNEPFREIYSITIPTNWAKRPLDAGPRNTLEQIEATGIRYRVTERVNGMATGRWQKAEGEGAFSGDLMAPFTKEFWDRKGRKRRARTLEVLKAYGDSTTVLVKEPVKPLKK